MFIYFNVVMYFDIKARLLDDSGKYADFNEQITINTKDIDKCYETGSINFHQNVRNIKCLTYYICDIIDYIVKNILFSWRNKYMFSSLPAILLFSLFGLAGIVFIIVGFCLPSVWMIILGFVLVIALIVGIVLICIYN